LWYRLHLVIRQMAVIGHGPPKLLCGPPQRRQVGEHVHHQAWLD
jgi:hypothetical protein